WLRPIRVVMHYDKLAWRRRQAKCDKLVAKLLHDLPCLRYGRRSGSESKHTCRMAIHHGHARTGGADAHRQRLQASRCNLAEDFAALASPFVFFLGDIGNNVIHNVEAEHTTITASAGDSL